MKLDIIKTEDIYLKAFKYIAINSTSNTLPYHNMDHLVMVFNNAYSASQYYKLDEVFGSNATKELCLAALFHDSNHSGGKLSDDENVANSRRFFDKFFKEYMGGKLSVDDAKFRDNVINTLVATEYPHKDLDPLTIQQKIIRDADMMSFNQSNHLYSVIFGLKQEFGVEEVKTQVKNQTLFTLNLEENLYTDWAKEKLDKKFGHLMNDLSILTRIFKDDSFIKEESPVDLEEDFMIKDGKKIIVTK